MRFARPSCGFNQRLFDAHVHMMFDVQGWTFERLVMQSTPSSVLSPLVACLSFPPPQEMAEQQAVSAALAQDDAFGQDSSSLDDELAAELESLLRIDDSNAAATVLAATATSVPAGATTASPSAPASTGAVVGGGVGSKPSEVAAVGDAAGQVEAPVTPAASAPSSSARGKATPVPG